MSGGAASMDSIPSGVRKTIQDIKEISRIHTDEEILAMLRECSMDPNETVQKLLSQDTFHEVKRKRDKRKENSNISPLQNSSNREPADSRWKPGMLRREVRSGRGTYSSRHMSHDVGVVRNFNAVKENGASQVTEKGITSASPLGAQETQNDSGVLPSSYVSGVTSGPTKPEVLCPSEGSGSQMSAAASFPIGDESSIAETFNSRSTLPSPIDGKGGSETVVDGMHGQPVQSLYQFPSPARVASVSEYASTSVPTLVPSLESHAPGVVDTIEHEVVSERIAVDSTTGNVVCNDVAGFEIPSSERATSELSTSSMQGKMQTKSEVIDVIHLSDAPPPSNSQFDSSCSRPSSNYSSRLQQIVGPQKVGSGKEWKPKSSSQIPAQVSGTIKTSDAVPIRVEMNDQPDSGVLEEATSQLNKKMLNFADDQHVIIPNHLQVPEAERTGLSFGSFDASFSVGTRFLNGPCGEKFSMPLTDSSQVPDKNIEEPVLSTQNTSLAAQGEGFPDHPQTSPQIRGNLSSGKTDISSNLSAVPEYDQNKQEATLAQGGPQFSIVHTAPTYSTFGLIPPMLGSQLAPFESSEPQTRDASPIPSFVVQQPFDPSTGYYAQIYQTGGDASGRFSPFPAHDTAAKCNGNVAVLSSQTGEAAQESANPIVVATTGPTPVVTQAGVMQSSVAVTQQPVPVFRQPGGMHTSHYPPGYIPYQYFSPFYVAPPTIRHFLNNNAFLQQPLAGGIYPTPAAAAVATNPVKNSLSQVKTGPNSGNSIHSGMPTGYGPYSSTPTGYSLSPAGTSGNLTGNEDITMPLYRENDVYITGQQSESSAAWVPAPGRTIPSVQASSLYGLSPQGQHVAFTPLQSGHSVFNGIYHPTQSVAAATVHPMLQPTQTMAAAVDTAAGHPASVYQQPQRAQINWANNY